ncbi:MAG: aldo/keto reductase [Candidatus Riflebacteria bacterium]|nr:aldo/keto reductase [Candidatus Riflebacteria bacterium]
MKRRDFLKATVAAASVSAGLDGLIGISQVAAEEAAFPPIPVYRTLGRTGLKVAIVSFGAMLTPEYEVIQAALDMGVNYIDTARKYMDGRNEEIVGKAIKGRRDKVFIATKTLATSTTKAEIIHDVETSLGKLKTDHIDVIQLHNVENKNKERIFNHDTREALVELRKQGKVRFFGVTSHTNQADILDAIVNDPDKFFDTALIKYNFLSESELKPAVDRAAKAKIGIIAMKTQMGGYKTDAMGKTTPHQAALKWVLQDTNVTTTIPGMKDMDMLREDIAVMGMKLTSADNKLLERYSRAIEGFYCHLCARCEPTCPHGVFISTINRSLMYAEGYGNLALARATYRDISADASATACANCTSCKADCIHGLDISARMNKARALFG